jgi:hypothetical protein
MHVGSRTPHAPPTGVECLFLFPKGFTVSAPSQVGGDVDAFCTRCKMPLGHTILAMVGPRIARVRCNTCQGEHVYRKEAPGTAVRKRSATASGAKPPPRHTASSLDALIEGRDISHPHRYSLKDLFTKGEVVDHPNFGVGVVVDVRGDRFDAVFREGVKTLAQRKAIAAATHRQERAPSETPDESADDAANPSAPISDA